MIEITQETIERVNALLHQTPKEIPKVFTRAINRSLGTVKEEAYKGVTSEYSIRRGVLKEYTKDRITRAANGNICGTVLFSGMQIPLYKYSLTTPIRPIRGVLVQAGQKYRQTFQHAFIATMKSGHTGIFERKDSKRFPIEELKGSSMRSMVSSSLVMDKVEKKSQETLEKRIAHEVDRILNG